jgi:hypothetical protein
VGDEMKETDRERAGGVSFNGTLKACHILGIPSVGVCRDLAMAQSFLLSEVQFPAVLTYLDELTTTSSTGLLKSDLREQ